MKGMQSRRTAFSLAEMILAITVGSVVMGALAVFMSRVLAAHTAAHAHAQNTIVLGQLSLQFRRDAHSAAGATVENDSATQKHLVLRQDGATSIHYEMCPEGVQRTVHTDDGVGQRELFALEQMQMIDCVIADGSAGQVSLVIGRLAANDAAPSEEKKIAILANLGQHARLTNPAANK